MSSSEVLTCGAVTSIRTLLKTRTKTEFVIYPNKFICFLFLFFFILKIIFWLLKSVLDQSFRFIMKKLQGQLEFWLNPMTSNGWNSIFVQSQTMQSTTYYSRELNLAGI